MNYKLFCQSVAKLKLLSVIFIVLFTLAGLYMHYCLLSANAGERKWKPLSELTGDWYYYMSDIPMEKKDPTEDYILENHVCLPMSEVQTNLNYDVYQYSPETWKTFQYPIKKGDGFSLENQKEIIISSGLSSKYPVGSVMEINLSMGDTENEKRVEFQVVGELAQEEILFRTPHSEYISSNDIGTMWNGKHVTFSETSLKNQFILIHPNFLTDSKEESSGLFFQASQKDLDYVRQIASPTGKIVSVKEILKDNESEQILSNNEITIGLLFWFIAICYIILWTGFLMSKCDQDAYYLLYIGLSQKKVIKCYSCMHMRMLIPAFLLSYLGYFLPSQLENFWSADILAFLTVGCTYVVISILGTLILNTVFAKKKFKTIQNIPFIRNLTLEDNIVLYLRANGYSAKATKGLCKTILKEKEINYCAKRRMEILGERELNRFREIILH